MRRIRKPVCCILIVTLLLTCTAFLAACGKKHVHSGSLTALHTDEVPGVPCCGTFLCTECGETYEASVTYKNVGLPVVQIEGDLEGISKTDKVTATVLYDGDVSFTSNATLKWQGKITLTYPKKNFSLQFITAKGSNNNVLLRNEWGKQSKYCLKANWGDFAGARNLVSAKLWGEIVHSRNIDDRLHPLVNGGAVDGYPVLLYLNGRFHGLYTLNTPKNRWIFGITKHDKRAGLLFCENGTASATMQEPIADPDAPQPYGWDVEYCSTEDGPEGIRWLTEGMNGFISFLMHSDDAAFKESISEYTDVDRIIDYMLFVYFICAGDNLDRNLLWITFDGKKYVLSAYDLDRTWKLYYGHTSLASAPEWSNGDALHVHMLFSRIADTFFPEICARYAALREDLLTYEHIEKLFTDHLAQIPEPVKAAEQSRWSQESVVYNNKIEDIMQFFTARTAALDELFNLN